ncbi:MAG TPA: hypothetical protein VN207_01385, partial [Ktedonobacteraceae bacterium]|nr:hypothetical protein [Ktedonobacteraceae bacterium]
FFNVHDDTRKGFDGNALSIACGPIQVDSSGLTGSVHLSPVQLQSQNLTALSTTQGDATLHLEPNAQLLAVQANISNAPPNTPLVMNVLGGNSCTGPILFPLQATSDNTGQATATMIFDDQQDTTIPSDWFFNVQTKGPDGNALSISCSPIHVDSSGLTGHATLSPVQPEGQNFSTQSTTQGLTTLHVDTNAHTLTVETLIFGAPPNTPLVMHVHGDGSCTGPILFPLQATSDNTGHASASMTFSQDINGNPLPTTIPSDWFFNVHDTTRQGLDGKPLSIACGPVQTIDPTTGFAKLDPVQSPVAPTPTQNPFGVTTRLTTLSTTEGLTTLQLDPNAHTLTIQANIFGAPPNTPLVMHVHGDGSCTGPILFPLQATSDFAGNASATITVKNTQDTTISNNWFFNVHDVTRQGSDGKALSIACGPIQVVNPSNLMAYALVLPVQPSQTAPIAPLPTLQGTTQGLSVLFLNAAQHILNVLVHLIGAPPNTPLALDIHGDGSCTGPTLFMISATSNVTGNTTALMPFNNVQDTKIPNNWFFTVHDPTKKGPDGQPLSIACGPIQTPGQVGLAQLTPILGPLTSIQ